ncbi:unnamed protein product [Lathyrus sativus]|nr:unnamed protein product [Lathyrus sativus]
MNSETKIEPKLLNITSSISESQTRRLLHSTATTAAASPFPTLGVLSLSSSPCFFLRQRMVEGCRILGQFCLVVDRWLTNI